VSATYSGLTDEGALLVAKWEHWTPPKGHASWCRSQLPPWMCGAKPGTHPRHCGCSRSATAKSLRRLRELGAVK